MACLEHVIESEQLAFLEHFIENDHSAYLEYVVENEQAVFILLYNIKTDIIHDIQYTILTRQYCEQHTNQETKQESMKIKKLKHRRITKT